jgi:hypothetical protein
VVLSVQPPRQHLLGTHHAEILAQRLHACNGGGSSSSSSSSQLHAVTPQVDNNTD